MRYDVMVAGAGPVGLMVAGELALRGISVLVVERLTEPDTTIKAGSVNVLTAQAFERRGLRDAMVAAREGTLARTREFMRAQGAPADTPIPRLTGHFAGIFIAADRLDPSVFAGTGDAPALTVVGQAQVEEMLAARAAALGVQIRRGVTLSGLVQDHDSVRAELGDDSVDARWLIGADGGRSVVRKLAGIDFPGTGPQITGRQAIVELAGAGQLRPGWNFTPTGMYVHGPMPGRIVTVEFDGPPADRDAPVTPGELQAALRRTSGVDVTITRVLSATRWTDNTRQAATYRRGRVFLAGDAAHVHSPFSGQGLNLGVGDAMNLGWKLAAEIQGWAPPGLLDTYTAERHPIGAWVLDWTRAQIAIMRPDPYARALRRVVEDLLQTRDGAGYAAGGVAGLRQRYDLGSDDPLVGGSAPDLTLDDDSHLDDHLHGGAGVLIDPDGTFDPTGRTGRLRVLGSGYAKGLLVRPDGIVAWAGEDGAAGRDAAVERWFG